MESRLLILLLKGTQMKIMALGAALALVSGCSTFGGLMGASEQRNGADGEASAVIEPAVARREIRRARIDTENFEVTAFGGFLSVEDFGTQAVYGARMAYHVTESLFAEATVGQSDAGQTSFENLSGGAPLLTDSERRFRYYDLSVGYNLLPGEVFVGRNRAFNSALYVLLGAGNTEFGGNNQFTVSFGAGYRVLLMDWLSAHFLVRDRMFSTDLLGEDKVAHNIEFSLGLGWFF